MVDDTLLYPNLGERIPRTEAAELPFYFALYGKQAPEARATAQLLRGGTMIAEAPVDLPVPTGPRVQHIGRLPLGALPAGTYELRINVKDGPRELSRAVFFTLVE